MPENPKYSAVMGIDGPIYIGEAGATGDAVATRLIHVSEPKIAISSETEEIDIIATGLYAAYVEGLCDLGITCTMRRFKADNADPADIAILRAAKKAKKPISVTVVDSAIGTFTWDYIVAKMDEDRTKAKVITWAIELKPTYIGRSVEFAEDAGGGGTGG